MLEEKEGKKPSSAKIIDNYLKSGGWQVGISLEPTENFIHITAPTGNIFTTTDLHFEQYCLNKLCEDYGHFHHFTEPILLKQLALAEVLWTAVVDQFRQQALPPEIDLIDSYSHNQGFTAPWPLPGNELERELIKRGQSFTEVGE